jgi:hypothetical protein
MLKSTGGAVHGLRHTVNIRLRHECYGAIGRLIFACSSRFDIAASFRKENFWSPNKLLQILATIEYLDLEF